MLVVCAWLLEKRQPQPPAGVRPATNITRLVLLTCRCSIGACEGEGWLTGGRSRDFTDALRPYERPARGLSWAWFKKALSPFPPPGLRHT